jgi:putative PEP-CTERM system TPR-repeat lipoprotein
MNHAPLQRVTHAMARAALAIVTAVLVACGAGHDSRQLLERANQAAAREEWRAAMIDLKNLLQQDPGFAPAREALARVDLKLGDFEGALNEVQAARRGGLSGEGLLTTEMQANIALRRFAEALAAFDREARGHEFGAPLWTLKGDALLGLRKAQDARKAYEQALQAEPDHLEAYLGRAHARFQIEGFEAARQDVETAQKLAPGDPRVAATLAELYYQNREFVEAERELLHAVELASALRQPQPQLNVALAGLARAQLSLGKVAEAGRTTATLIGNAPHSPAVMYLRARALFIAGEYEGARGLLEQILARQPQNTEAQLLLGAVTYAQGNLGQADMYLGSVVAAEPDNGFARRLLIDVRLREGKTREAKEALPRDLGPGADPILLALAGRAKLQEGDLESGLTYLEQGAAARPDDPGLALELATGYLATNRLEQAVHVLEGMGGDERQTRRRDLLLIIARLRARDLPHALEEARTFVERYPQDAFGVTLLGSLWQASGKRPEARAAYERALRIDPKNIAPYLSLAKLELIEGQPFAAEARLRKALALAPGNAAVMVTLAQLELSRNRPEEALKWLETARSRNERAIEPRLLLAQYFLSRRDFERAEALASETLQFAPGNAPALNVLGLSQSARGRPEEGIATLEKAQASAGDSVATRLNLAKVYLADGRAADAMRACERALAIRPDYAPALALAAALSVESQELGKARGYVGRLEKSQPGHPLIALLRGDIAFREKDYAGAARYYESASPAVASSTVVMRQHFARKLGGLPKPREPLEQWLQKHPEDASIRLVFAQALEEASDTQGAISNYELAVRSQPGNPAALNNLAWLYHRIGDTRALDVAARAYAAAPSSGAIVDTYGWLMLASDPGKAAELLGKARALVPDNPSIQYHYAVALQRTGKPDAARRTLEPLLGSDVSFAERAEAESLARTLSPGVGATNQ